MEDIGKKIHAKRIELRLTLEEVAQAIGVSRSTVLRWEKGDIKSMGFDKVPALAKVLQMDPVEFVPGFIVSAGIPVEAPYPPDYADQKILEALHQNPKLRLLFDRQKDLSESDMDAVLGVVNAIQRERGEDD